MNGSRSSARARGCGWRCEAYEQNARPLPGESHLETQRRVLGYGDDRSFAEWLGDVPPHRQGDLRDNGRPLDRGARGTPAGHGIGYFALVWNAGKGLSWNIVGGASRLIEALAAGLDGRILTRAKVREVAVETDHGRIRVACRTGEHEYCARHVVLACKAFEAGSIASHGPPDRNTRGARGHSLRTDGRDGGDHGRAGPMPWDHLYALATPARSFNMLFNAANVLRPRTNRRDPGGSLTISRPGHAALDLFERLDAEIEQTFLDDLYSIFPQARGLVRETLLLRMPRMLPYIAPGRAALQPALERPTRSPASRR